MTKVKLKDATRELLADATKVKEEASRARKGAENLLQSLRALENGFVKASEEKDAEMKRAEAEKQAAILRAEAQREARIREAEGEAEAILKVQTATAEGIKLINEAAPTDAVLRIKALEAFGAAANGQATKIIIPSEIQGLAGLAAGIVEAAKESK